MKEDKSLGTRKAFLRDFFRARALSDERMYELAGRSVSFQRRFLEGLGGAARPLVGTLFPGLWQEMRPPKISNAIADPGHALAWVAAKLGSVGERVRCAIGRQAEVEAGVLRGQVRDRAPLEEFEAVWGRSLWSLDLRFVVAQFHRGFHGNRTELASFQKECGSDWVKILAATSSFRAQLNVSTVEYNEVMRLMFPGGGEAVDYLADSLS